MKNQESSRVIVQLGGNEARSSKTTELHRKYPEAIVILTGVENYRDVLEMLPDASVILENNARDTLTNFIYTRDLIGTESEIYLVTDRDHMRRALGLARIIYGRDRRIRNCSEGIPMGCGRENLLLCLADWARAYVWVITKLYIPNNLFGLKADRVFSLFNSVC
jgi:uncharacterized SAM-binding protein YcdF (DUF218 family)